MTDALLHKFVDFTHTFSMRWYEKDNVKKVIIFTGITLAVYFAMKYVLPIVIPFLFGGLLAMMLNPMVERVIKKTGRGRSFVSMVMVAVLLAVSGTACYFAGRAVCTQLAALVQHANKIGGNVRGIWCDCCDMLAKNFGMQMEDADILFTKIEQKVKSGFTDSTLPYLLKNSVSYAKAIFSIMSIVLVSLIAAMLMLSDYPKITGSIRQSAAGRLIIQMKQNTKKAGGMYLKAQMIILLIISLICVVGLFLTGNPYALLAGVGIGLCDALPFVGTGTIFVPWMVIDIVNGNYILAAVYAVLYVICSFVRQLLEPRLIGDRLGFPPIAVLMSIYIGIHVYGVSGVILGPASAFLIYELYLALVPAYCA